MNRAIHINETLNIKTNNLNNNMSSSVAKIQEIIGTSDKGWEDAAQVAVKEAIKTVRAIHGIEVIDQTAQVDSNIGKVNKYKTCIKFSFGVEEKR